ncbi:SUKH-4 family immunity protein [Streptomyces sp. BH055]|uniref:SUKH-4 family immunity protein n=1 Tax=Streptomyces sp. BH055 TaxID=3401173 RepID=UPI003BB5E432
MYESVSAEAAVDRIVGWHREGVGRVVELMGSGESSRMSVLQRLREQLPGSVSVDAGGLDGDALVGRIREALGQMEPGVGSRVVIVAEGRRIVGERVWDYPQAALDQLEREVAQALGVLLVIEVDWHEVRVDSRAQLELQSALRGPDPRRSDAESREWALQALALQEGGGAPLEVWRRLSWLLNQDEIELPVDDDEIEVDRRGWARFRNFRRSRELAGAVDPGQARKVHADVARWLVGHVGEDSDVGRYADAALVEHAKSGPGYGEFFRELKARPEVVARLSENAFLKLVADNPAYARGAGLFGHACQLWEAGLRSRDLDEWSSWLNLVAVAQEDETAAEVTAVRGRPWTVRWARWRPPGVIDPRRLTPGYVDELQVAPPGWAPDGRPAVVATDRFASGEAARSWVFDVATGELLAGPWSAGVPEFGRREALWQDALEGQDPLRGWDAFDPFYDIPLVIRAQVRIGDIVLVASAGGVFAVEGIAEGVLGFEGPADPDGLAGPGSSFMCDFAEGQKQRLVNSLPPEEIFGAERVVRLPASLLPEGLRDEDARTALTNLGVPRVRAAEIDLDVSPGEPPREVAGRPALYALGTWSLGVIAVHGDTGRVYRLPEHDDWDMTDLPDGSARPEESEDPEDDFLSDEDQFPDWDKGSWNVDYERPHLMAENLTTFVRLLTAWTVLRLHFPMAYTATELTALRDKIDDLLGDISDHAVCSWWTENLQEVI